MPEQSNTEGLMTLRSDMSSAWASSGKDTLYVRMTAAAVSVILSNSISELLHHRVDRWVRVSLCAFVYVVSYTSTYVVVIRIRRAGRARKAH